MSTLNRRFFWPKIKFVFTKHFEAKQRGEIMNQKNREDVESTLLSREEREQMRRSTRRQFLKIGAATIGAFALGGGALEVLHLGRPTSEGKILLPRQNPAFRCESGPDGSWLCYALDKRHSRRIVYRLNSVGAEIWRACNGKRNAQEISEWVAARLNVQDPELLQNTKKFLGILERESLVVTHQKVREFYNKVMRYERT